MKIIPLLFLTFFIVSGCAGKKKKVNSRKYKNFTAMSVQDLEYRKVVNFILDKINKVAECELITNTYGSPNDFVVGIKEYDLPGDIDGYFTDSEILLDPRWRTFNDSARQTILFHEIGHALGYQHTSWDWHIMHAETNIGNISEKAFKRFVNDIKLDFGCKN